jgi:hypothetical protein
VSDDLAQFLRARYAEEAQAAQKASALCGCHPPKPSWTFGDDKTDGRILVEDEPHPNIKRRIGRRWSGTYEGLFMAQHIVRHDPAHVLADIEAKRAVVDFSEPPLVETTGPQDTERTFIPGEGPPWALGVLQRLALPYAAHPDYRAEWRP